MPASRASIDPATLPAYRGFVDGDAGARGMAQPFHHTILPLASAADRRTEVRWGLRDFEVRFGRRPSGMWLPETAADLATLRLLADEGMRKRFGAEGRRRVALDFPLRAMIDRTETLLRQVVAERASRGERTGGVPAPPLIAPGRCA